MYVHAFYSPLGVSAVPSFCAMPSNEKQWGRGDGFKKQQPSGKYANNTNHNMLWAWQVTLKALRKAIESLGVPHVKANLLLEE